MYLVGIASNRRVPLMTRAGRHILAAALCAALLTLAGSNVRAADFSETRLKMEAYRAELANAATAYAQGNPTAAQEHEARAKKLLNESKAIFEAADVLQSSDIEGIKGYAEVLAESGDYDLAAEALEHGVELAPDDAALWAKLGEYRFHIGPAGREPAFKALQKSLKLDESSNALALRLLGDLYFEEGLYEFAGEYYTKARKIDPKDILAAIGAAILKVRSGEVVEGSGDIDALGRAAQPYDTLMRVRLRRALADFDEARRYIPDTAEAHRAYAKVLYRAARIPEAILAAQRSVILEPKDIDTWNFLAAMYMQLGNYPGAIEAYGKSLDIKPDQTDIQETVKALKDSVAKAEAAAKETAKTTPPADSQEETSPPPMLRRP